MNSPAIANTKEGAIAKITGFNRWKIMVNGPPVEAAGWISMALALQNGQWKIISFHRSVMPY